MDCNASDDASVKKETSSIVPGWKLRTGPNLDVLWGLWFRRDTVPKILRGLVAGRLLPREPSPEEYATPAEYHSDEECQYQYGGVGNWVRTGMIHCQSGKSSISNTRWDGANSAATKTK